MVRDGETGLLFTPGRSEELATCLEKLERDPELAMSLGRRGRALVETEFHLDLQVRRMLTILEEVASSASR